MNRRCSLQARRPAAAGRLAFIRGNKDLFVERFLDLAPIEPQTEKGTAKNASVLSEADEALLQKYLERIEKREKAPLPWDAKLAIGGLITAFSAFPAGFATFLLKGSDPIATGVFFGAFSTGILTVSVFSYRLNKKNSMPMLAEVMQEGITADELKASRNVVDECRRLYRPFVMRMLLENRPRQAYLMLDEVGRFGRFLTINERKNYAEKISVLGRACRLLSYQKFSSAIGERRESLISNLEENALFDTFYYGIVDAMKSQKRSAWNVRQMDTLVIAQMINGQADKKSDDWMKNAEEICLMLAFRAFSEGEYKIAQDLARIGDENERRAGSSELYGCWKSLKDLCDIEMAPPTPVH